MRSFLAATILCAAGLSLAGCAAQSVDGEEETLEGEVGATDDALAAAGQYTFFRVVRQDFRKCAWPMCGGVYVARVNRAQAQCADGSWQSECYVADFDWKALGLVDAAAFQEKVRAGTALVRGKIEARKVGPTTASTLVASEGWEARIEGATATGYFSRFTQREVKCMSLACASYDLSYLNLSTSRPVHAFATKALPTGLVPEITAAFGDRKIGVLVAGDTYLSGGRRTFVPSQIYTQPKAGGGDGARCGGRGTGPCADGYFCSFPSTANCGRADASRRVHQAPRGVHRDLQAGLRLRRQDLRQRLLGGLGRRQRREDRRVRRRGRRDLRRPARQGLPGGSVLRLPDRHHVRRERHDRRVHRAADGLHQGVRPGLRLRRQDLQQRLHGARGLDLGRVQGRVQVSRAR